MLFDHFGVAGVFDANVAVMNAFFSGRTTALVIDSGASHTFTSTVVGAKVISHTPTRNPLAGDAIDKYLQKHLSISSQFAAEQLKFKISYVARDYEQELKNVKSHSVTVNGRTYHVKDQGINSGEILF